MGLRADKRQRIRGSIIENAIALFREQGFEASKVRDIAARCEVSEATFFNYFPTKDAVLSCWSHGLVELAFERATADRDRALRSVLREVCGQLADQVERDRAFAARAFGRARLVVVPPAATIRLIEAGQAAGTLRRDLSARQLAEILYVGITGTLAGWLAREAPTGSLASELRRAADLVLDGARRRNERVRPAAGAASQAAPVPVSTR
jgi:AcrR family transcriptional regulator